MFVCEKCEGVGYHKPGCPDDIDVPDVARRLVERGVRVETEAK